jgi:hypothetical protein
MKKLAILILVALGVVALGCGHSNLAPPPKTQTGGEWEAQLIGGTGQAALLNFVTDFNVTNTNGAGNEPLSISSFGFFNVQSCFVTQDVSGSANLTTSTTNLVTGSMVYTVTSVNPGGNTLTLTSSNVQGTASNGSLTNGVVTGSWSLTGSCAGGGTVGGTFTLCQGKSSCSTT